MDKRKYRIVEGHESELNKDEQNKWNTSLNYWIKQNHTKAGKRRPQKETRGAHWKDNTRQQKS